MSSPEVPDSCERGESLKSVSFSTIPVRVRARSCAFVPGASVGFLVGRYPLPRDPKHALAARFSAFPHEKLRLPQRFGQAHKIRCSYDIGISNGPPTEGEQNEYRGRTVSDDRRYRLCSLLERSACAQIYQIQARSGRRAFSSQRGGIPYTSGA